MGAGEDGGLEKTGGRQRTCSMTQNMFYDREDEVRRRAERLPACHRASRDPAQTRARQSDSKFHAASPTRLPCLLHFRLPPPHPPHPPPLITQDHENKCQTKDFRSLSWRQEKKTGAKKRFFALREENGREGALTHSHARQTDVYTHLQCTCTHAGIRRVRKDDGGRGRRTRGRT
jgi:hypothetical protein